MVVVIVGYIIYIFFVCGCFHLYDAVLPDMAATCGDHAACGEASLDDELSGEPHGLH